MRFQTFMRRERARTAYHESGHAVIAYILGFTPYRATINPGANETGPYIGEVRIKVPEYVFLIPHSMAQYMIHELAGIAAQDRYSRRRPFNSCQETDGAYDLQSFGKHWFELYIQVDGRCSDCDAFQLAAEHVVRHHWTAIDAFAKVLQERETIENEELEQALAEATETCERFSLWDHIHVGLENAPLPFGRYADLAAEASRVAQEFQAVACPT